MSHITREDIESLMPKCPKCKSVKYKLNELIYYRCSECSNSQILSRGLSPEQIKNILDELDGYSDNLNELEFIEFYTDDDFKRYEEMGKIPILDYKPTKGFELWLQEEHHRIYKGHSVECPKCNSSQCVKFGLIYKKCRECSYAKLFRLGSMPHEEILMNDDSFYEAYRIYDQLNHKRVKKS